MSHPISSLYQLSVLVLQKVPQYCWTFYFYIICLCSSKKIRVVCGVWCSGKEDLEKNRSLKDSVPIVNCWGCLGAPSPQLWTAESLHSPFPSTSQAVLSLPCCSPCCQRPSLTPHPQHFVDCPGRLSSAKLGEEGSAFGVPFMLPRNKL